MKRLLASVFSAITLAAAPAKATTWQQAWIQELNGIGVRVIHSQACPPDIHGLYQFNTNTLTLCMNNMRSITDYNETLVHETVHVIQDCFGGRTIAHIMGLANHQAALRFADHILSQSPVASIRRHYHPHQRELEYEAFALQDRPSTVQQVLRVACRQLRP